MNDLYNDPLPPVLAIRGMRLMAMGRSDEGRVWLKFGMTKGRIREVTVFLVSDQPSTFMYEYAVHDASTHTVVSYSGRYGDPTKDTQVGIQGSER